MVRGNEGSFRSSAGGILSLAEFANEHHKALEADLLQIGYELKDVGRSLSWGALLSFISNLGSDSAVFREMNPELGAWGTTFKTNAILADIYDMLALINANIVAIGSREHTKNPKRYPRPYGKDDGQHFGSGAVPVNELRSMFAKKRKDNGRK